MDADGGRRELVAGEALVAEFLVCLLLDAVVARPAVPAICHDVAVIKVIFEAEWTFEGSIGTFVE